MAKDSKSYKIHMLRSCFGPEGELLEAGTSHELRKEEAVNLINRGKARFFTEEDEAAEKAAKAKAKADKPAKPGE